MAWMSMRPLDGKAEKRAWGDTRCGSDDELATLAVECYDRPRGRGGDSDEKDGDDCERKGDLSHGQSILYVVAVHVPRC